MLIDSHAHINYGYKLNTDDIIHNMDKRFEEGHTHVKNFKTAKFIIDLAIHKSIPHHLNIRILESIYRISDDNEYRNSIKKIIDKEKYKRRR